MQKLEVRGRKEKWVEDEVRGGDEEKGREVEEQRRKE